MNALSRSKWALLAAPFLLVLALGMSSWPMHWVAGRALGHSPAVEGLSGNFFSGYRFDSLRAGSAFEAIEIRNGRIALGLADLLMGRRHLSSLEADKVAISLSARASAASLIPIFWPGAGSGLEIETLTIRDFSVSKSTGFGPTSMLPLLRGGEVQARNLKVSARGVLVDSFEGRGPWADFKMSSLLERDSVVRFSISGTLKPAPDNILARPIPFSANLSQAATGLLEGQVAALGEKVRLTIGKGLSLDLRVQDVALKEELRLVPPLKGLSLSAHVEGRQLLDLVSRSALGARPGSELIQAGAGVARAMKGSFLLGGTKFELSPVLSNSSAPSGAIAMATGAKGGRQYALYFGPLLGSLLPGIWTLQPIGQAKPDIRNTLAQLLYGKGATGLSSTEKLAVSAASRDFWKAFPPLPAPPLGQARSVALKPGKK